MTTEPVSSADREIRALGHKVLPPEPGLVEMLGQNHAIESSIADLIDNSFDAGATKVLVRFVRRADVLLGLLVIDDGRGMDETALDAAMTLGARRSYESSDLGHFGVGLKAASFGHADRLTVASKKAGSSAVGRRWLRSKMSESFECDILDPSGCAPLFERAWTPEIGPLGNGTVVRWDDVASFSASHEADVVNAFLERTIVSVRTHLGITFHRLLETADIYIDVEDLDHPDYLHSQKVDAIDPFGYTRPARGRPATTCSVSLDGALIDLEMHIWPPGSTSTSFKLGGQPGKASQGFFFYRRNRLVQCGGWNGLVSGDPGLQLARVKVDVPDEAMHLARTNPEKTAVRLGEEFVRALDPNTPEGIEFRLYLDNARDVFKASKQKATRREPVIKPGRGFAPAVRQAIASELDFLPGEDPIQIRWCDFLDDSFFEIDRQESTIWINKKYRWALNGDSGGSLNDAPLMKATLYLLLEGLFRGAHLGSRDQDNIKLWSAVLGAAAKAEIA